MSASLLLRRGMQKKMDLINRKFSVNYGHFLIKLLYFFQIEGKPPGCSDFIVVICDLICMPYFREALGSRWPQGDKVAWHDLTSPGQHRQHSNTIRPPPLQPFNSGTTGPIETNETPFESGDTILSFLSKMPVVTSGDLGDLGRSHDLCRLCKPFGPFYN